MLSKQVATVIKVKQDKIIIKLSDGQKISWPKDKLQEEMQPDEQLTLVLTSSQNLLNEIIDAKE